ncbi:hypothetical protein SH449x_004063 [Pirellulaceae bacterium SH449]
MSQRLAGRIRKTGVLLAAFTLSASASSEILAQTDSGLRLNARFLDQPSQSERTLLPVATGALLQDETSSVGPAGQIDAAPSLRDPIALPPLSTPNLSIASIGTGQTPEDWVAGRLPEPQTLPFGPDRQLELFPQAKAWVAPAFCHQPLYFEDTMLERHGHEKCPKLTPMLSGARFYTTAFFSPYLAVLRPPLRDISNAGHYRPGSAAPGLRERAPYDPKAMRLQLLTLGTFAIP